MSYYHTSREHVKNLKAMQDNQGKMADRRRELAGISVSLQSSVIPLVSFAMRVTAETALTDIPHLLQCQPLEIYLPQACLPM